MSEVSARLPFSKIFPILLPAFVDKVGNAGLTSLSGYLVHLKIDDGTASLILGSARSASVVGPLLIGLFIDKLGYFPISVAAFLLTGLAFLFIPLASSNSYLLILLAFGAQFGIAANRVSIRGLLFGYLPASQHREGLGWLRSGQNLGSVCGMGAASLLVLWWMPSVFVLDGITSLLAGLILFLFFKEHLSKSHVIIPTHSNNKTSSKKVTYLPLVLLLLVAFSYQFTYDLFDMGTPARLELAFPNWGMSFYFKLMVINTVFCGILALKASRYLTHAGWALFLGLLLNALGGVVAHAQFTNTSLVVGMTLLTLGEIAFHTYVLLMISRFTQHTKRPGFWFGASTSVMSTGRPLAGFLVFPLVVSHKNPAMVFTVIGAVSLGIFAVFYYLVLSGNRFKENEGVSG